VATIVGKDFEPITQLQCSRKSPRLQRMKPYQKSIPTASFRLSTILASSGAYEA